MSPTVLARVPYLSKFIESAVLGRHGGLDRFGQGRIVDAKAELDVSAWLRPMRGLQTDRTASVII